MIIFSSFYTKHKLLKNYSKVIKFLIFLNEYLSLQDLLLLSSKKKPVYRQY